MVKTNKRILASPAVPSEEELGLISRTAAGNRAYLNIRRVIISYSQPIKFASILVPRAHDPSGLWQGSRALAGTDFLSMRRIFVSNSQPIRFARFYGKSVNRGLPVLHGPHRARALDPCHRPEGSWALGTRMICQT